MLQVRHRMLILTTSLQTEHAADDLLDDLPGSDAFADLVRMAVAKDPSLADTEAARAAAERNSAAAHSPPALTDLKKPPWLRQRAPQGVGTFSVSFCVISCSCSTVVVEPCAPNAFQRWRRGGPPRRLNPALEKASLPQGHTLRRERPLMPGMRGRTESTNPFGAFRCPLKVCSAVNLPI